MKSSSIVAMSVLATATALYTGFWFYQSEQVEKQAMAMVEKLKNDAALQNMEFSYSGTSKGGFPFKQEIHIIEPKLTSLNPDEEMRWISADGIAMSAAVFGNNSGSFSVDGDVKLALVKKNEEEKNKSDASNDDAADESEPAPKAADSGAGKEEIYKIKFSGAPRLTVKTSEAQELQSVSYEDGGFAAFDPEDKKIAAWNGTRLSLNSKNGANNSVTYQFSLNTDGDYSGDTDKKQYHLGKTSLGVDAAFTAPANSEKWMNSNMKLDVSKLEFHSDVFNFSVKGTVDKQVSAMLPVAVINLAVKPAGAFANFISSGADAAGMDEGDHKKLSADYIKTVMEKLSDSQNLNDDDFTTTIKADDKGNVTIGKLTMEQAMAAIAGMPVSAEATAPAAGAPASSDQQQTPAAAAPADVPPAAPADAPPAAPAEAAPAAQKTK